MMPQHTKSGEICSNLSKQTHQSINTGRGMSAIINMNSLMEKKEVTRIMSEVRRHSELNQ